MVQKNVMMYANWFRVGKKRLVAIFTRHSYIYHLIHV